MKRTRRVTRRGFLRGATAAAFAAPLAVRSSAFGANDRITTAIMGLGGPAGGGAGGTHLLAVCDVRDDKLGRHGRNPNVKKYRDFRRVLDRDDVDAVLIGTPDHWHTTFAVRAAEAGKDIYCEKPLTLTIREGRALVNAVRRYARVFQTGSQQRSEYGGKFRFACEMVRSGRIGRVHTVHVNVGGPSRECYLPAQPVPKGIDWDMWLGPAPWRPFHRSIGLSGSWRSWRDYSGGGMTDWGHHHFDIVQWALDKDESGPIAVHPPGTLARWLTYIYDVDGQEVRVHHGGASGAQIEFKGTEGRVMVDRGTLRTDPPLPQPWAQAQLGRVHPHPPQAHLPRGSRLPLRVRLPPRQHLLLDPPPSEVGPRERRLHRRPRGLPLARPPQARPLVHLVSCPRSPSTQ